MNKNKILCALLVTILSLMPITVRADEINDTQKEKASYEEAQIAAQNTIQDLNKQVNEKESEIELCQKQLEQEAQELKQLQFDFRTLFGNNGLEGNVMLISTEDGSDMLDINVLSKFQLETRNPFANVLSKAAWKSGKGSEIQKNIHDSAVEIQCLETKIANDQTDIITLKAEIDTQEEVANDYEYMVIQADEKIAVLQEQAEEEAQLQAKADQAAADAATKKVEETSAGESSSTSTASSSEDLIVDPNATGSGRNWTSSDGKFVVVNGVAQESGKTSGGKMTKTKGVVYFNGHKETYYSQRVLPGNGLKIPGRHVNSEGLVCDGDGYICLASSDYPHDGTVAVLTSLGWGKVYDCGCASGTIDIYVDW